VKISRSGDAKVAYEYGCDLRRLFPWPGVVDPLWGSAIASVRPNEATSPHSHDEEETFIILNGNGVIAVDGQSSAVQRGDVIYLPRNSHHTIRNTSASDPLEFLTIFWGSVEANQRMHEMVRSEAQGAEEPVQ
jgi:mannose-6-phosphate isomerase-like protein (cupin superfamily)